MQSFFALVTGFPYEDYPVEFYLLLFPTIEMMYSAQARPEAKGEINKITSLFRERFAGRPVTIIDYSDPVIASEENPYFKLDSHFNRVGHRVVADELLKAIVVE